MESSNPTCCFRIKILLRGLWLQYDTDVYGLQVARVDDLAVLQQFIVYDVYIVSRYRLFLSVSCP